MALVLTFDIHSFSSRTQVLTSTRVMCYQYQLRREIEYVTGTKTVRLSYTIVSTRAFATSTLAFQKLAPSWMYQILIRTSFLTFKLRAFT